VHDGEALAAHEEEEAPEGLQVGERGHVASEGRWEVVDTSSLQGGDVWARGRDAGDLVAGGLEAAKLVEEQVVERQVNGGDVGDLDTIP
jgi:hypothetical protein